MKATAKLRINAILLTVLAAGIVVIVGMAVVPNGATSSIVPTPVIYDTLNIRPIYASGADAAATPHAHRWAQSVGVLVEASALVQNADGEYHLRTQALGASTKKGRKDYGKRDWPVCADHPMAKDQVVTGRAATAVYLGQCIVLTCGHNLGNNPTEAATVLAAKRFVFDFQYRKAGERQPQQTFKPHQVYTGTKLLGWEFSDQRDYALVLLDKEPKGVPPLGAPRVAATPGMDGFFTIGHSLGAAKSVSDDGKMAPGFASGNTLRIYLDAFDGASGSPVFDVEGRWIGQLVGGDRHLDWRTVGNCRVPKRVPRKMGDGQKVMPIGLIEAEMKAALVKGCGR